MSRNKRKNSNSQVTKHTNRKPRQNNRHDDKCERGMQQISIDESAKREEYTLDWFKPVGVQKDLIYSICTNELTVCQGGSGCGKSTTSIYQALTEMKRGLYKHLVFIKTPSELGSDQIGFLSGDASQKLEMHFDSMRSIFHSFMSKAKLEMEEKRGRIQFTIPNFVAGKTFNDSILIIDEAQLLDPNTLKLLLERISDSSKIIILGDKGQRYSVKKRDDGLSTFIDLITDIDGDGRFSVEDMMGYVEMTAKDNMRGRLSKRIGELYEE